MSIYIVSRDATTIPIDVPCLIKFKDNIQFDIPGYVYEPVISDVFCLKRCQNVLSDDDKRALQRCNDISCMSERNDLNLMNVLISNITKYCRFGHVIDTIDILNKHKNLYEAFKCYVDCYDPQRSDPALLYALADTQPGCFIDKFVASSKNEHLIKLLKRHQANRNLQFARSENDIVECIKNGADSFGDLAQKALKIRNYEVFKFIMDRLYVERSALQSLMKDLPDSDLFKISFNRAKELYENPYIGVRVNWSTPKYTCVKCKLPFDVGFKIINKQICSECVDRVFFS